MKVYDDGTTQLYHADSRALPVPDESVDMVMTSPPYYSARKYGEGAGMVWDAAEGCEHVWGAFANDPVRPASCRCEKCQKFGLAKRTVGDGVAVYCPRCNHTTSTLSDTRGLEGQKTRWLHDLPPGEQKHTEEIKQGQFCQLCSAWRGQLGLEPSLELYIAHLMQIADECWRVLKGGVMVWNLGDSYAGSGGAGGDYNPGGLKDGQPKFPGANAAGILKPLDLCMVPSRVALALQERGWYLRSFMSWVKRASMPESQQGDRWERCRRKVANDSSTGRGKQGQVEGPQVRTQVGFNERYFEDKGSKWADCPGCPCCLPNDGLVLRHGNWRPGKSLEWLFVLSKTGDYYSDSEGVRVGRLDPRTVDLDGGSATQAGVPRVFVEPRMANPAGRNRREMDWFYESLDEHIAHHEREARRLKQLREQGGLMWDGEEPLAMLLNPKGYKEAHFATYPPSLCEPFIKAYTSDKGNCAECGKPWVRVVDDRTPRTWKDERTDKLEQGTRGFSWGATTVHDTLGWRPTCTCHEAKEQPSEFPHFSNGWLADNMHAIPTPAVILDPFAGACSTAIAAGSLGRKSIMIECCKEYLDMAIKRLGGGYSVKTKQGVEVKQTQMFGEDTPGEEE